MPLISRGFHGGRRTGVDAAWVPPGQYADKDSPVLSAGPTPSAPFDRWLFTVDGAVGQSRSLAHRAHQPRKIRWVLAVREGKSVLGGGCRRGTTVPGHPVPGPGHVLQLREANAG
jgi:hypothetical protein